MKKQNLLLTTVAVILIGAGGYFYYLKTISQNIQEISPPVTGMEPKKVAETKPLITDTQPKNDTIVANTPATTAPVLVTDPLLGIDYSSLEKNRFYTYEETGTLSETETWRNLLAAISSQECAQKPNEQLNSDCVDSLVNSTLILSLKNDKLLLEGGISVKAGAEHWFDIYDLKQKRFAGNTLSGYKIASNEQILILIDIDDESNAQKLFYYRPGMSTFGLVPSSSLPSTESYWYLENSIAGLETIGTLEGNILKVSVFRSDAPATSQNADGTYTPPKKVREVTFDLSTLK